MDFSAKLDALSEKLDQLQSSIQTEEATKNAFIMPFIQTVLGYDVFDPKEVTPEFIADLGVKKGEKVDYAILRDGEVQMLFECKKAGDPLDIKCASQLFRYFSVTTARIAILTNGQVYKFYADLDAPNKMDERPFLILDLLDIDDHVIPELLKLTKQAFDLDSVISSAEELKYVGLIKKEISNEFSSPSTEFLSLLIARVYDGKNTQKVKEQFAPLVDKALRRFLNDSVNDRLKTAISSTPGNIEKEDDSEETLAEKDDIVTTQEEIDGFNVVKAIVRSVVNVNRITARDTLSYCGILLDDNNRKPICRLHFNRKQKYIGVFDENKNETRYPIDSVDDIFNYVEKLKETVLFYEQ